MMQPKPPIRLYVTTPLASGERLTLEQNQSHYLLQVMRRKPGDQIALFNGQNGEWLAELVETGKKSATVEIHQQLVQQKNSPDLWLAFAPIKNKTELVVEKATELGVSALLPVFTRHAVVKSINMEKLIAHAIEAAEQCERHDIPRIEAHKDLPTLLRNWPKDRVLLYGDESGGGILLKTLLPSLPSGKYAILIGPEGGFSAEEHRMLKAAPFIKAFSLGPRILRADTAAVAALACVQAWLGDWDEKPAFEAAHG